MNLEYSPSYETDTSFVRHVSEIVVRHFKLQFINKFSFVGRDDFSMHQSRLAMLTLFKNGRFAITRIKRKKSNESNEDEKNSVFVVCDYFATGFDVNGRVTYAAGYPSSLIFAENTTVESKITEDKTFKGKETFFKLNRKNTVFFQSGFGYANQELQYKSLENLIEPLATEAGRIILGAHFQNFLTLGKPVIEGKEKYKQFFSNLYSFEPLELKTTQDNSNSLQSSVLNTKDADVARILSLINFDNVNISNQYSAYEKLITVISNMFGFKKTQTFKKARLTEDEARVDEETYKLLGWDTKATLDAFISDFNKTFELEDKPLLLVENMENSKDTEENDEQEENDE